MEYNFSIGELVFTIRKINSLTQVDFSKKLGVVQSTVSKVEKDIFDDVPFSLVSKISSDFDIPLQCFQYGHLPTKKNIEAKKIIPSHYIEEGVFGTKTIYQVLKQIEKSQGDKIYKDLKIKPQYLSLSSLKYSYEFVNKLYSLLGASLIEAIKAAQNEIDVNQDTQVGLIENFFNNLRSKDVESIVQTSYGASSFTLSFSPELASMNDIYSNMLALELGVQFGVKINIDKKSETKSSLVITA